MTGNEAVYAQLLATIYRESKREHPRLVFQEIKGLPALLYGSCDLQEAGGMLLVWVRSHKARRSPFG